LNVYIFFESVNTKRSIKNFQNVESTYLIAE